MDNETSSIENLAKRTKFDWEKWAEAWKLLVEGSRPSRDDISTVGKLLDTHLKGIDKPTIVILGSTPELRDLCMAYSAEYDAKIICIELVQDMYKAMSQLVFQENKNETVVFSNWVSMDLPDSYADAVIGDLTEGNITPDLLEQYYAEINRVLKYGGKYITRTTAYIPEEKAQPMKTYDDVLTRINEYKSKVLNGTVSIHSAGNHFGAELAWDSWYKIGKDTLSISAYTEELAKLDTVNDATLQVIMKAFHTIWDSVITKYWNHFTLEKTMGDYERTFKDVKVYYANDYPSSKYTPTFEMTKK